MSDSGHVRCKVGIVVWGRMCGNRELGGEPGSLLLYIIFCIPKVAKVTKFDSSFIETSLLNPNSNNFDVLLWHQGKSFFSFCPVFWICTVRD